MMTMTRGTYLRRTVWIGIIAVAWASLAADDGEQSTAPAPADAAANVVYILPIHGEINDLTLRFLERGIEEAREQGAQTVVFDVDTPGGLVTSAIDIAQLLKNLHDIRTVAWVNPEAISAGSLISLAANDIVISPRAKIGDCAAIMVGPQGMQSLGETERAKIDSYILAEFRDSAQANDYPLALCEAMVTLGPAIYRIQNRQTEETLYVYEDELPQYDINEEDLNRFNVDDRAADDDEPENAEEDADEPGDWRIDKLVLKERSLLTMLTDEAIEYGFADRVVADENDLLAYLESPDARIIRHEQNWSEAMVAWLTSPFIRGILTIVLLMGLYSEMQSPGLGLAGGVALLAAAVLLGAPYLTGLADAWEIVVIMIGFALLLVEIFFIPGFGIAGIGGLVLMFFGLLLTFVPEDPDPGFLPNIPQTWTALGEGLLALILAGLCATVGMVLLTRYFGSIPLFNRLILAGDTHELTGGASAGVGTGMDVADLSVGDVGHTLSELRPIGRAEFGSAVYDVTTSGAWIDTNTRVRVVELTGSRIVVEEDA